MNWYFLEVDNKENELKLTNSRVEILIIFCFNAILKKGSYMDIIFGYALMYISVIFASTPNISAPFPSQALIAFTERDKPSWLASDSKWNWR